MRQVKDQAQFVQTHHATLKEALRLAVNNAREDEKTMRDMAGRQRSDKLEHPFFPPDEGGALLMEQVANVHKEWRKRAEEALLALMKLTDLVASAESTQPKE